jgi:RNA-directed DNA polymerase
MKIFSTTAGTPQGGVISPTLLTITLSGLEQAVYSAISNQKKNKVYISTYADDFIITGISREVLKKRSFLLLIIF